MRNAALGAMAMTLLAAACGPFGGGFSDSGAPPGARVQQTAPDPVTSPAPVPIAAPVSPVPIAASPAPEPVTGGAASEPVTGLVELGSAWPLWLGTYPAGVWPTSIGWPAWEGGYGSDPTGAQSGPTTLPPGVTPASSLQPLTSQEVMGGPTTLAPAGTAVLGHSRQQTLTGATPPGP